MDIKEIALKLLAKEFPGMRQENQTFMVEFAEALISAYKAKLQKEVGEPVAVTNHAQLGYVTDGMHPDIPLAMWAKETSYSGANVALYTSDQVAAAILKATGPLEDSLAVVKKDRADLYMETLTLRDQLAAAQEKINRPPAIDAYETYMADDEESNPVERLRFFLSLALKGQDWIDVEKFIDDVSNHIANAEQRVAEACSQAAYVQAKWFGYNAHAEAVREAIRSGEWRKFVKEV